MASTLRERLSSVESDFLSAVSSGPDAISSFQKTWAALLQECSCATNAKQIDAQTSSLAHTIASRVAVLAETLLSLETYADHLRHSYTDRCAEILARGPTSEASYEAGAHDASLDHISHHWLMQNLHDPYPSSAVKASVASNCSVAIKDVQDWFIEARRQIGWTALSRVKFNGSRRATTEAASLVYADDHIDHGLPFDISRAFDTIKANAASLLSYPHFSISESIDETLSNPVPEVDEEVEKRQPEGRREFASSMVYDYTEEDEDTTPPPAIAGSKRHFDVMGEFMEETKAEILPTGARPSKRHRSSIPARPLQDVGAPQDVAVCEIIKPATCINTKQSTASDVSSVANAGGHSTQDLHPAAFLSECVARVIDASSPAVSVDLSPHSSRKRRLSDAGFPNSHKRPRGLTACPRRQTVSDPLPSTSSPDGWEFFAMNGRQDVTRVDMSDGASLEDLDPSLFADAELAALIAAPSEHVSSQSSLGPVSPASQLDVCDADLVSATMDGFDLSTFTFEDFVAPTYHHDLSYAISEDSSISSPSSTTSLPELAEYGLPNHSSEDWSQLVDIINSLDSSPISSQSSLSDYPASSRAIVESSSSPSSDDIARTLFGVDRTFTPPDLLSDIGFSSLHMPLEAFF